MLLNRDLMETLVNWKDSIGRKPLLLRGARQVGKSSLIAQFGARCFQNILTLNFELSPQLKKCFETLQPSAICDAIRVISQEKIIPGETLLFLDEIQDCPEAIQALRYFKELMPELHVIGAGSLLELKLKQADFRMPVGRVSFLYLYPLSFSEFLQASNPESLGYIQQATLAKPVPAAILDHLLKQLRLYMLLGGMPEVIAHYLQTQEIEQVQAKQSDILTTYENDFGHYAKMSELAPLQRCFKRIPMMVGQQIKYNKIEPDMRSRELKLALSALEAAAIMQRIHATSATGLPLDASVNDKKFKMNFVDVGLVKRINQLDASLLLNKDIMLLNQGALAEQFVGQELLATSSHFENTKLYFWARDESGGAEVDYVRLIGDQIVPIEVKSGKLGRLRSLQMYLETHDCTHGVRISVQALSMEKGVLTIPLYMVGELDRLVGSA